MPEKPEEPEEPVIEMTKPIYVEASGVGLGWLSATITVNGISKTVTKNIQVLNNYPISSMSVTLNHYSIVGEPDIYVKAVTSPQATTYDWYIYSGTAEGIMTTHCPEVLLVYNPDITPEYHILTVEATNGAISGTASYSVYGSYTLEVFCLDPELDSYPNPVSDILNIEITHKTPETQSKQVLNRILNKRYDIRLYTIHGNLVHQTTGGDGKTMIDVSKLPNGIYMLHVYDGNSEPLMRQIIVGH
jgi:hypothetical protein